MRNQASYSDDPSSVPLRIIVVYQTNPFEARLGGGARYVRNLVGELRRECDEILFLGVGDAARRDGCLRLIPVAKSVGGYLHFLWRLLLKIVSVDLSGYSLVHVHRIYFAIPFLLLKPGLKVVCTQHGRTFSVFQERYGRTLSRIFHPIARMIERFALKRVDRLVFVSQDVADTFAVKYPILMADCETRTSILGSMVELEGFGVGTSNYLQIRYGGDNRYILFLGRLAAVKDLGFLIELASCELQDQPQTKLILVGDGEDAGQLQEKAAALCSANMPLFHGPISATDVPALLQSADLLILCSQHEASPTVIKEALATGLPVLTNDVGDAKDFVISGKNGRVVQKTVKSYLAAIEEILGHTLSREVVFRASESRLVQCTPEFVSKEYLKVYRSLVPDLATGVSPS